jgi:hypothetical protein
MVSVLFSDCSAVQNPKKKSFTAEQTGLGFESGHEGSQAGLTYPCWQVAHSWLHVQQSALGTHSPFSVLRMKPSAQAQRCGRNTPPLFGACAHGCIEKQSYFFNFDIFPWIAICI